ncbi:PSD1 and planctomycete cytochrome C domain-containing protein [Fuerstiella marisgermanici]|uniref:Planctomycete cytochrome C n=1 Tax=Fuerstiella marisgermanici TaxID=1891926 RepID=A0A1P8W9A8_9PLAN|nr:PSD1 and planctomycete cytochrome C domain-containing protein [Fuerstiella marisgermanici]APZ90619.1 Planctomycete cytochrome C [Fuerstiella marisgermanici]
MKIPNYATILLLLAVAFPACGYADEPLRFSRDVLPILADRCFHCHGPDAQTRQADLRLDERKSAVDEVGAIVPKSPEDSELIARVTTTDPDLLMPPPDSHREPLKPSEVAILKRWIAEGAVWGQHWAFEKPIRPKLGDHNLHPIDAFVTRRLKEAGLQPSPMADKRTLIRRVTLDLIGLPPTVDELNSFLADESPDAYEQLVDRLLDSPHYGERMACPWLDAARYADTSGFQGDPERSMWPWRDWVVKALNDNMPFDDFTIEQLAGDLLDDPTPEQRLATGFNRNHMHNGEGGRIAEETRVENVFDRAETTGTVWLGLTLQCARCHDHKFDPTSNDDYFAFYDFFNQTTESGRGAGGRAVPPSIDYVLQPDQWPSIKEPTTVKVMVMDTVDKPRDTLVLVKGVYNNATDRKIVADVPGMLPPLPKADSDRRYNRLDLARWIVSPDNPLTARVTVNRYWQTFFGRGIVTTPSDFGLQGAQPTHPDLLDWLAVEFVESDWDVKHIHRLIVTSQTYKQSAKVTPELLERDPQNELMSRSPRFRMPSWMIRDHALATSGLLIHEFGGPPVKSYQPSGIWAEATFGKIKYQVGTGGQLYRRSLYSFWRRIVGPTIFFDSAKRQTCEVQPNLTNTPLHALTTLNDVTYIEAARVMAEKLLLEYKSHADRVAAAFEILTSREAAPEELTLLTERLRTTIAQYQTHPKQAAQLLKIGQLPKNETLDPAEHAALTTLLNTMMNLDEVLVKP